MQINYLTLLYEQQRNKVKKLKYPRQKWIAFQHDEIFIN